MSDRNGDLARRNEALDAKSGPCVHPWRPSVDDARTREVGPRHISDEADEQSGMARCRAICGGTNRGGVGGAKGGDQGECGPAKYAPDAEPHKRVTGAGAHTENLCRHIPEVGAVCGKAARTVLKRAPLPLQRRKFITLLGGAAAWPLAARAQQGPMKRVGVLLPAVADDPVWQARVAAFQQALAILGWVVGRNLGIDVRWATANTPEIRKNAAELAALVPDVILAGGNSSVGPLLEATRTVPVVFAAVADPVGAGFVDSLARPGGNATGFMVYEFSIGGKWLELLKQIAPGITRVAVLRDASLAVATNVFVAIQAVAPSLRVEVIPLNMRDAGEIEQSVGTFARSPNGGLIPAGSATVIRHRDLIIRLAARHKLPALYWDRAFVAAGGLVSYGPDPVDGFRQTAGYVDRILKGEKPAELPVQAPTKYETVLNLKTAKALGLEMPPAVLARADEVIE